jgi:hypothetical protein
MLFVALLWVVLVVFLAAWTLWFQAYIYSEPVGQIYWRAPAAGTVLGAFFLLWVWLDYSSEPPGRFRGLFEFSARQDEDPYKELIVETNDGREETYTRFRNIRGQWTYQRDGKEIPTRPKKITAVKDGQKLIFEPEMDAQGHFKARANESLRYVNKDTGRVMLEGQFGQISTFRWWWLFQNLFLNFVHFVVWLACLWLVLKFQFWHSFGMAFVGWLAMTLFVLPPLLNRAEEAARHHATVPAAPAAPAGEKP